MACQASQYDTSPSVLRPWQTRTHCCGHIVADTNVSPCARARNICCGHKFCVRDTKNVSDFVQKHFVSATNVSQFAQPKKHHGQQCVRNNVSSFTRAFTCTSNDVTRIKPNRTKTKQENYQSIITLLSAMFKVVSV